MTYERSIADAFAMSETTWMRHANPWSVYTRFTCLPLLVVACWSRVWLGYWSLLPIALAILWTWLNPRLFAPVEDTQNWASRAVLGERIWLNRDRRDVPAHHHTFPHLLNLTSAIGAVIIVVGVVQLDITLTLLGMSLAVLGKLWYVDRMVWLCLDQLDSCDEYRSWKRVAPVAENSLPTQQSMAQPK